MALLASKFKYLPCSNVYRPASHKTMNLTIKCFSRFSAEKECDLDKHCGVLDPERKKVCTRLLTCNVSWPPLRLTISCYQCATFLIHSEHMTYWSLFRQKQNCCFLLRCSSSGNISCHQSFEALHWKLVSVYRQTGSSADMTNRKWGRDYRKSLSSFV